MEKEIMSIKEDIATLKTDVKYIKSSIDEMKRLPCRKIDFIETNRKMIYTLFVLSCGIISYLTGIKILG